MGGLKAWGPKSLKSGGNLAYDFCVFEIRESWNCLPPFIVSLLPEGWLESVLKDKDERAALRSGKRYMSNITIVERQSELAALPRDVLLTRLEQYSTDGVFTGTYAGPGRVRRRL